MQSGQILLKENKTPATLTILTQQNTNEKKSNRTSI